MRHAPILLLFLLVTLGSASAQLPYRAGEEVEVTYLGEWRPARVLNTDRRQGVYCQYTFVSVRERWFDPSDVRRPYEKDAIARARLWKDAGGKFSVVAALLKVDATNVKLRTEAEKEIEVPIDKLSTSDQTFLKRLAKSAPVASGSHRGDVQDLDLSAALEVAPANSNTSLQADPMRSTLTIDEGGAAFEVGNIFDKIGAIIPLGGNDQWLLASLENSSTSSRYKLPTRLMWVSIRRSKMERMHPLPPQVQLKDYYAASQMALTYDANADDAGRPILTLWKSSPSMPQAEAKFSWYASDVGSRSRYGSDGSWARFASDRVVLFRDSQRRLIAWNLAEKKAVWTATQQSSQAPTPELTPNRRYLLVPETNRLRVIDPIQGVELATLACDGEIQSLDVADDGDRVVMLLGNSLEVVDLTGGDKQTVDVGFMDLPGGTTVQWLTRDVVCLSTTASEMLLLSLDRGIPLWRYEFDSGVSLRSVGDDRVRRTIDGHLVYAAPAVERIERGYDRGQTRRGIGVGVVKLPGDEAAGYVKYLKRDELVVFDRGESVRVEVSAIENQDQIRDSIVSHAEANGWTIDDASKNILSATLERGPAVSVQYNFGSQSSPSSRFGPPPGFGPPPSFRPPGFGPPPGFGGRPMQPEPALNVQSASVQPYVSTIELAINGQPAWRARSSSVPQSVRLEAGENLQTKLSAMQAPDIDFFDRTDIPEAILNPEFRTGLGTSLITSQGLQKK